MIVTARMLDRDGTEQKFEHDDELVTAPDAFVHRFCVCKVGDLYFVEILQPDDTWLVWRCNIVAHVGSIISMISKVIPVEEAREEIMRCGGDVAKKRS